MTALITNYDLHLNVDGLSSNDLADVIKYRIENSWFLMDHYHRPPDGKQVLVLLDLRADYAEARVRDRSGQVLFSGPPNRAVDEFNAFVDGEETLETKTPFPPLSSIPEDCAAACSRQGRWDLISTPDGVIQLEGLAFRVEKKGAIVYEGRDRKAAAEALLLGR